jgi:hypothetical protein
MRIRLKVGMAGKGFSLSPGDIIDKPDGEAHRLIAAGYALPVLNEELERATDPAAVPVETRTTKPRRRRRAGD